jgi:hypothetical protein
MPRSASRAQPSIYKSFASEICSVLRRRWGKALIFSSPFYPPAAALTIGYSDAAEAAPANLKRLRKPLDTGDLKDDMSLASTTAGALRRGRSTVASTALRVLLACVDMIE